MILRWEIKGEKIPHIWLQPISIKARGKEAFHLPPLFYFKMTNEADLNAFWNTIQKSLLFPPEWHRKYQQQTYSYLSFGITLLAPLASNGFEWNKPLFPQSLDRKKYLKVKVFSVEVLSIVNSKQQVSIPPGIKEASPTCSPLPLFPTFFI